MYLVAKRIFLAKIRNKNEICELFASINVKKK